MSNTAGDPLRGEHTPVLVAILLVATKIFAPFDGYGEAVNEFEAFGLDLAENSTVVYPEQMAVGSSCAYGAVCEPRRRPLDGW